MSEPVPTPGTEACGCCAGTSARTPRPIHNRPGLPEVAYRSGTHSDFRASMLAALFGTNRKALSALRTRDDDDPTIALLDAWAVACDVLTFYTERLANESYLRTATERTSLQELGRLITYRLNPGVAAETHLAFTLESPPVSPPSLPLDPGLLPPTLPSVVRLEPGLRVQSVPGPAEQPQTFETVEAVEARPEWNALPVARTTSYPPVFGRSDAWIAGTGHGLKRGDPLLFAGTDLVNDRWDVRLLTATEEDAPGNRTHVRWDRGLGSFTPPGLPADAPGVSVLRKRIPVFGHNAPVWLAMNGSYRMGYAKTYGGAADGSNWHGFTSVVDSGSTVTVDLAGSHPDVVEGSWVVVSQEAATFYRELYRVVGRSELSRSEFGVSGTVTRLTLDGEKHAFGTPREVTVLAVADPLTLVEAPDLSTVSTTPLVVEGDATAMRAGRTLVLCGRDVSGADQAEVVTLASATPLPPGRTLLALTGPPAKPYDRSTAVVFGNVAKATNGETVQQLLGDGDARRRFQAFALRHTPLTFVQAGSPAGSASTLTVRVDDVAWHEVATLYGTGSADRVFVTRTEPDGTVVVAFGDGARERRLPSGSHNVRARYRKGLGAAGNVAVEAVSQPLDRPLGLKAVTNPLPATGGVDPETETQARRSMPLPVRTLGRAVSLQDYSDFALAFSGISIAGASVLTLRAGRTVVITVAGPDGAPAPPATVQHLTGALRRYGDPHVRVEVVAHRPASFRVALKVRVDSDHEPMAELSAVEQALRTAYAPSARQFGQPVHRSAVVAAAASLPGVVAVDLDRLYRGTAPSLQQRLPAAAAGVGSDGRPVAAELLAVSDAPFDWMEVMQ